MTFHKGRPKCDGPLTLGVTTGLNSISAKNVLADFGITLKEQFSFPSLVPHTGTNGITGKLNHSSF